MTAAKDLLTTEGKFLMKSMSRLTPEGDKAAWARDFIAEPKYGTVHGGGWRCSVYDRRWINFIALDCGFRALSGLLSVTICIIPWLFMCKTPINPHACLPSRSLRRR
jgi:hypothetical protein